MPGSLTLSPVTAGSLTSTPATLSDLSGVYVNVKAYGAIGDGATNDTAAIQAAIDAAHQQATSISGFVVVFFPEGTYVVTGQLTLTHHVYLLARPGTATLDFSTAAAFSPNNGRILASGTAGSSTNVTATVTRGDAYVTVNSTSGLTVGDTILIGSTEDGYYNEGAAGGKLGELAVIVSVDTGNSRLYLSSPAWDTYTTSGQTVTVRKVGPFAIGAEGLRFKGKGINPAYVDGTTSTYGDKMFEVLRATRLVLRDCEFVAVENKCLEASYCSNITVERCRFVFDTLDQKGQYGVNLLGACHWWTVRDCYSQDDRHLIVTSGTSGGGTARQGRIEGNHCVGSWQAPISTQGCGEGLVITGNTISSDKHGMILRSRDLLVQGNNIRAKEVGVQLVDAANVSIVGNRLRSYGGSGSYGISIDNRLTSQNVTASVDLLVASNVIRDFEYGIRTIAGTSGTRLWEGAKVVGNTIVDCWRGVDLGEIERLVFTGNTISGFTSSGALFRAAVGHVIVGNVIENGTSNALEFVTSVTQTQVVGNILDAATPISGGPTDAGSFVLLNNQTAGTQIATSTAQKIGFHGATPVAKQTVSGSRGSNAALASVLTALANLGLIVDSSS